ncbi:NACHT domain-containing protein [Agrobacterium tumefaciens]|uniref:NACHT domain-containing protein n=1 Tax=Agrobacterium tumefaciens TaxID=358 RepID=UPI0012B8A8A0|nr:ATP-binding protein [Agrobacterium tumefaciens]MQB04539.1 NACHT domain-containing protein [Agrobacterium tumefaciens]
MYKGGIADKVGNRYEARWLTHQLLRLLDGTVQTVTVEALGDDEQGFEFSLDRANGSEWHQCKRQTAAGTWSLPALDAAGVLTAFRAKTSATNSRCLFISSDPAPQMKLLQDKLPAAHNVEAFEANLSKAETQHWGVLKERLGCNGADVFRFLGNTEFRTLSEHDLAENLRARIAYWFKGDPDVVAAQFRAWLEEDHNFNRPIGYDDVIAFVRDAGIETKQYELDRALPGRIRDATASYISSYPPLGAGLFRIERAAVREVLIGIQAGARVVLLAGAAGVGKSAIIADVIEKLQIDGTLHLAFRVDQAGSVATLYELGTQTVGTPDNPVVILEQLSVNQRAVLVIDQADAVSEVSGRIAELRRVVLELVRKATLYPRVQLVFACRSFDLENDHAYREIANTKGNVRVDVSPFQRADVESVLVKLGILYDGDNSRLMALLALPIGLTLAAALAKSGISDLRRVEHLSELYGRLLAAREQEIQREFRPGWSIYAPLTAIAAAMSERQELVAPVATLDPFAGALDLLQRIGMIVARGQRIGFIHESLFDYLHARAFVQERRPLIDFLLASEQTLFRRTQTRQILAFERELERARYLTDVGTILSDTRVRPHIRETVVRWLATIADPSPAEWDLIARYAARDGLPVKVGNVIYGRKPWFDFLDAQGVLDAWLASEGDDLNWVLGFLRSVAPLAPGPVAERINSLLERRPDRIRNVFRALRFIDSKADAKPIADSLIAALDRAMPEDLESGEDDGDNYYGSWIKGAPAEAARIFGAQLRCWSRFNPEIFPLERRHQDGGSSMYWLTELAQAAPLDFLEQILPFMRLAMERSVKDEESPAEDSIWYWRRWDRTDIRSVELLDVVRGALAETARVCPSATMRLLRALQPQAFITSLHLLLETIPANPEALHDLLIEQIDNPGLFKAGWYSADGHSAGVALAAAMPWLSEVERGRAEAAIFALRPEIDLAKRALDRQQTEVGGSRLPPKTGDYATYYLNNAGKREWSVLLQIEAQHLSLRAAKRLAELNRKFVGQKPDEPDGIRGGMVRSPIAGERTKFMNDDAWLSAIQKFSKPRDEMRWRGDGLRGGAMELSHELKERAKDSPERFLALLARFPEGTYQDFAWGVIAGIAEAEPDTGMIERVLAIADENPAARPDDRTLIWMIRASVGPLGSRAEELLLRVATGDDDSSGIGDIDRGERGKEPDWKRAFAIGGNLNGKAINSARGSALAKLGSMCWDSKEIFEKYKPMIDPIVGLSAAAHVQSSMSGLLLSALKHDGKRGIAWTLRTAHACPEALYTNDGQQIVGWVAELDADNFTKLVNVYLINDDPLARGFAALAIFQKCLDDPDWLSLAEKLIEANAENRSAAAAVAAANFESVRFGTTCTDWLIRLFDDADKIVRHEASDCFRLMRTEDIAAHSGLFEAYVGSKYFESDRTYFLHRLKHAPPRLDELVLKLLEDILAANTGGNSDPRAYELHEIGELVLKLYASNVDHPDRQTRALNLIDQLVECGLMDMQKLEAA